MDGTDTYGWNGITIYYVLNGMLLGVDFDGGTMNAVVSDALGNVRLVVDPSGIPVFSAGYDAWGDARAFSNNVPGGFCYRYVGEFGCRYDADTGLTYMRQRWYDARLQRFVSRDLVRGSNRYMYGGNNPVVFVDPFGLRPYRLGEGVFRGDYLTGPQASKVNAILAAIGSTQSGSALLDALNAQGVPINLRVRKATDSDMREITGNSGIGSFSFWRCKFGKLNLGWIYNRLKNPRFEVDLNFPFAEYLGIQDVNVVAHELGHIYQALLHPNDYIWGKHLDETQGLPVHGYTRAEWYAIQWENRIAKKLNLPLHKGTGLNSFDGSTSIGAGPCGC